MIAVTVQMLAACGPVDVAHPAAERNAESQQAQNQLIKAAAPRNFSVEVQQQGIRLQWDAVQDVQSYNIYRSTSLPVIVDGDALAENIQDLSYIDTEVQRGTTYYYAVRAVQAQQPGEVSVTVMALLPAAVAQLHIVAVNPANNSENVAYVLDKLQIAVNESLLPATVNTDTVYLLNSKSEKIPASLVLSAENKNVDITPNQKLWANEDYTLVFSAQVLTTQQQSLSEDFSARFGTQAPQLSMSGGTGTENSGQLDLTFALDAPSAKPVQISYQFEDGVARAGDDFVQKNGQLMWVPGEIQQSLSLQLIDDAIYEDAESLGIRLDSSLAVRIENNSYALTIQDNETIPVLTVLDASGAESDALSVSAQLNHASAFDVQVDYLSVADSAGAADYSSLMGALLIAPGELAAKLPLTLIDDTQAEADERFYIDWSNVQGASLSRQRSEVHILNDDKPDAPVISVSNAVKALQVHWTNVAGAESYRLYYADAPGLTPENYAALNGVMLMDVQSPQLFNDLSAQTVQSFLVTAVAGSVESAASKVLRVQPRGAQVQVLNDTGLVLAPDVSLNMSLCNSDAGPGQDCHHGRDAVLADDADGLAGFQFSKIAGNGGKLDASTSTWSCVLDEHSGLMWQAAGYPSLNYEQAWQLAAQANADGLCSYHDWRVPNISELYNLVYLHAENDLISGLVFIDVNFFAGTLAAPYWTQSEYFPRVSSTLMRVVNFANGRSETRDVAQQGALKLVRGGTNSYE